MDGLWLISYLVLWALFLIMAALLVGMLQQMGSFHERLDRISPRHSKFEVGSTVSQFTLPDLERGLVDKIPVPCPILVDKDSHVRQLYQVRAVPLALALDGNQMVMSQRVGPDSDWFHAVMDKGWENPAEAGGEETLEAGPMVMLRKVKGHGRPWPPEASVANLISGHHTGE